PPRDRPPPQPSPGIPGEGAGDYRARAPPAAVVHGPPPMATKALKPPAAPPGLPRSAGVLLHVTSLPSKYGIGDLGPAAYRWVDELAGANQTWWQVLPLTPVGEGNSPYSARSAFAGNPMLVSPAMLASDGLLEKSDLPPDDFP